MKKISVNGLVEFRKKSNRAKKTFVEKIKSNKVETPSESGGNYWVSSLSAVCNSYKTGSFDTIDEKIDELQKKLDDTEATRTKNMYKRNISILQKYKSIDLKKLRPGGKLSFLKKSTGNPLLTIKGLQIEAKPSHIYTFGKKEEEQIGAIWFIIKKDGYRIDEVGMFCDMLYRFLKHNYVKKYQLLLQNCLAVDILSSQVINYSEIEDGTVSQILNATLDEINRLM